MASKIDKSVKNLGMIPAFTKLDSALERASKNRETSKYSFGDPMIDDYCGGGWGRDDAYELVCVFGGTGMNKSTLLSQMVISPAAKGDKVAYLALEDELEDVIIRLHKQLQPTGLAAQDKLNKVLHNIDFFPENDGYSLDELANVIEELFNTYDVIVVDPIQFVFEASIVDRGETEWNRQRVFMRKLRNIVVRARKPLVFVSHTNKSAYNKNSEVDGIGQMMGSGGLPQICTKIIQIDRDKDGLRHIKLLKTRFTKHRFNPLQINLSTEDMRIYFDSSGLDAKQIQELRDNW